MRFSTATLSALGLLGSGLWARDAYVGLFTPLRAHRLVLRYGSSGR